MEQQSHPSNQDETEQFDKHSISSMSPQRAAHTDEDVGPQQKQMK